jgi:N6-adenosine-specific RNA methylase IME4
MSTKALLKIPVGSWADKDCILASWATWPKLDEAINLIYSWGFTYVTAVPWIKTAPSSGQIRRGVGFWTMGCSEVLLLSRKGKPKRHNVDGGKSKPIGLLTDPESDNAHGRDSAVFYAPRGKKHSQKPLEVHEWLERYLEGPYLELFATQHTEGWTCWGYDLGQWLSVRGVDHLADHLVGEPL